MKHRILLYSLLISLLIACEPENTPPHAAVQSVPGVGDTATVFMLDGKNSSDAETSYFALRYRWDTNADGTWDTEYSTRPSFAARFSQTGYQHYILEVADDNGGTAQVTDSVYILNVNHQTDYLTDSRDGKIYEIVKISGNWWMAENLRFGMPVSTQVPLHNDETAEYFSFNDNTEFDYYGGLYTWNEAQYYPGGSISRSICPPGWKIPSTAIWTDLFKNYPQPFDIQYYFGRESIQNLGIEMHGYFRYGDPKNPLKGEFLENQATVRYWTSDFTGSDTTCYYTGISLAADTWKFVKSFNRTAWIYHELLGYIIGYNTPEACYVRCVKE